MGRPYLRQTGGHMALDLENPSDERKFKQRLAETIAWCSRHGSLDDPKNSLRTFSEDLPYFLAPELQVSHVASLRREKLYQDGFRNIETLTDLQGGRLLFYTADWTLSTGGSQLETYGFFDAHECPPFDTWVWFVPQAPKGSSDVFDHYLVAWIPPVFLELVEKGIEVCPTECLGRLDKYNDSFTQSLRA